MVCATHKDLGNLVSNSEFRDDLFFRLNVFPIQVPSLSDRLDDIPLLIDHLLKNSKSHQSNNSKTSFSKSGLAALKKYDWPGNIRELRNFCENLVVLNRGGEITPYDLDSRFFTQTSELDSTLPSTSSSLSVEENEKRLLRNALLQAGGNRTKAAELMGVSRRTLHRKLVRWPELDTESK